MPYSSNRELPKDVKEALPFAAQDVFRTVFNRVSADGSTEEDSFKQAWGAVKRGWLKGPAGAWIKKVLPSMSAVHVASEIDDEDKPKLSIDAEVCKVDEDQRIVYGWASVIEKNGAAVVDSQGDIISVDDLCKAAHQFLLYSREAGDNHQRTTGIGKLVESMVFTKEIQKTLGIDLAKVGWLVGFKIDDQNVWKKVKSGEYAGFSIGGRGKRIPLA